MQSKIIKTIPPSSLRKNPTSLNKKACGFFHFKYFNLFAYKEACEVRASLGSSTHNRALTSDLKLFSYGKPHHSARLHLQSQLQDQGLFLCFYCVA